MSLRTLDDQNNSPVEPCPACKGSGKIIEAIDGYLYEVPCERCYLEKNPRNASARAKTPRGGFSFARGQSRMAPMDLMKELQKKADRKRLTEALEKIREATWRTRQTLPELRREIALILKELKDEG